MNISKLFELLASNPRGKVCFRVVLACAVLFFFPLCSRAQDPFACPGSSPNPIVCENSKIGSPQSQWDLSPITGDSSIQGFGTDISVNQGGTINFKIQTDASAYTLTIYRMGYYAGLGARQIAVIHPSAQLPQNQPDCITDSTTGLVDCGNWAVSASWAIPSNAISGIYFAKITRSDTGGASHIFFVVRSDSSTADVLYQASDATWQAYNDWGGNSLYCGPLGSNPSRAFKVSYNRPFNTREPQACGVFPGRSWVFHAEYPMIRWLEANGYNVSYFTDTDTDRNGSLVLQHKVFLVSGHDEYWSAAQRANVEAARAAGVNLAFFTGNGVYWKTRRENSIDGSNTPYRTLVTYKETVANTPIDPNDPPTWTGTWRDPRFSPPADGGRPENALTGTLYMVNGQRNDSMVVPQADGRMRFWRNTALATLAVGNSYTFPAGTLGDEWDIDADNGSRPPGTFRLSTTTLDLSGSYLLLDFGSTYGSGTATHDMTMYRYSSGALVFGAGTIQWSWGLDANHDDSGTPTDVNMQQATVNLLADMGAQAASLQSGLKVATASTDRTPPTSSITSPVAGSSVTSGSPITITGTAADAGGGVVGGVEVSVDGGSTWHPVTGRENWSYLWTPPTNLGPTTIKSRATDDSGNIEAPSSGVSITIAARVCPCTIWSSSSVPAIPSVNDNQATELGVLFTSDAAGYITGIRFYKGTSNTGTHTGSLWSGSGALLATATFIAESASGWQQINFSAPVAITANTTYVASYHTNVGYYASDAQYFANSGYDNVPLHALSNPASGGNGVYAYSSGGVFPTNTYQNNATNYWVDVVFNTTPSTDSAPVISKVAASSITSTTTVITWTTDKPGISAVNYGTTAAYGSSQSSTALVTSHSITLTGLTSNTLYHYQVETADSFGTVSSSSDFTFTTADNAPVISNVTASSITFATAVITWTTDKASTSLVNYGTTTGYGSTQSSSTLVTGHRITLTGLASSTLYHFKVQSADSLGTVGTSSDVTFTTASSAPPCPCTIWTSTTTPGTTSDSDPNAVELGVRFTSDLSGYITGIRFYKGSLNTGTHTGSLWSSGGTLLATATFTGETASGWQQVTFATPVAVTAGATFVASYHTTVGHYSRDQQYFATANYDNAPLHALANGTGGGDGVYVYGTGGAFPTNSYNSTNYYVDVVFNMVSNDAPPAISGVAASSITSSGAVITWSTDKSSTSVANYGTTSAYGSSQSSSTLVTSHSVTLAGLTSSTLYHYQVQSADPLGLAGTSSDFAFSTSSPGPTCPCSIWTSATTPGELNDADGSSVELGVKFTSDLNGYITGLRFYKGNLNTGTHTGSLWSVGGTLLATATFTGETASGWQQVNFATPVAITAGASYVASYHTTVGHYSRDLQYFAANYDNAPLHALANGTSGGNGVYVYGGGGVFPTNSYNSTNYYVDVVFSTVVNITPAVVSGSPSNGRTNVNIYAPVTATFNEAMNGTTITTSTFVLTNPSNNVVSGTVTYNSSTNTATLTPASALAASTTYVVTIAGGSSGVKDVNGNAMSANYSWSFTTGNPALLGQWTGPYTWPDVAINLALMPNGQVMVLDGNNGVNGGLTANLWNPTTNAFTAIPNNFTNLFCSGHAPLADGRLVTIGGHIQTSIGLPDADLFDPSTNQWSALPPMAFQRWYPTATTLPDGRILSMSGTTNCAFCFALTPEIYSADTNAWTKLQRADLQLPFYPFNFVLPDGRIFNAGTAQSAEPARVLDIYSQQWTVIDPTVMNGGSAVMYQPGKIMKAGRHYDYPPPTPYNLAVPDTSVIDMTASSPAWKAVGPMHYARTYGTLTALPDGTVLATSGSQSTDPCDTTHAVYAAELWSPSTQTWTTLSSMQTPRLYHSTALLLPNGQVVIAGGGRNTPCTDYPSAEIFSPPYLFKGAQPSISSAPSTLQYGSTFFVGTPNASTISMVSLIRLGAVTHAFDQNQTFQSLSFSVTSGGLNVVAPANANTAPPGYYMLFLVSNTGVPSVASFVIFSTPLQVISVTPLKASTTSFTNTSVSASFNAPMDATTITTTNFQLHDPSNNLVAATVSYNPTTRTASLVPNVRLAYSTAYTATVGGGSNGVKDSTERTMAANFSWTFTTAPTTGPCPCTIWSSADIPGYTSTSDPNAGEFGVKFTADFNGSVLGIRFYKGSSNTGTHTGSLWSSTGTLLATATFTNETATGWQQVSFTKPVPITAGTTYIASYHTNVGYYSSDPNYFVTGMDNSPLHAPSTSAGGGNGVYAYGASAFPTSTFGASSYWVDVVYTTTGP